MRKGRSQWIRRMLVLVHETPGRMRLLSAAAKGYPARAAMLAAQAHSLPGVVGASANPLTGSLVIRYDAAPQRRGELLRALGARIPAPPESGAERMRAWLEPIVELLAERLAECVLRVAIAAMI
jgi:hypothetical protein